MKIQPRQNSRGFTLVELLVVFVIIVVLVTVSITAIFRFRKSADKAVAIGNLRQLQSANTNYAVEHNGQFVPPTASVDGVKWYENPELIAALKGDDATYGSGGAPNLTLPLGLMDPAVVREKPAGYQALAASYGYTVKSDQDAMRQSQLADPARSAAFITATGPHADFSQKTAIAYRHDKKAVVAYYDGHAVTVSSGEIEGYPATHIFWKPKN